MNNVRSICITGSSGFIGRHLVKACSERWPNAQIDGIDIANKRDCRHFFANDCRQFDLAIHCAAITGGIEGTTNNAAIQSATNAQLDGAFFEWAIRTRPQRIVYFSSSCAYPLSADTPMTKPLLHELDIDLNTAYADGTPYGAVKLTGEIMARSVRDSGVSVSIVRPFAVYGEDQELCRMIPMFVKRALSHSPTFEVWGPGYQASDFIHVDDATNAVIAIIDLGIYGPVNLATGRGTTVDEAAVMVMKAAGINREIVHNLDKPVGPRWRVGDPTLLQSFYTPKVTIEEGIERTVALWQSAIPLSYGPGDDLA